MISWDAGEPQVQWRPGSSAIYVCTEGQPTSEGSDLTSNRNKGLCVQKALCSAVTINRAADLHPHNPLTVRTSTHNQVQRFTCKKKTQITRIWGLNSRLLTSLLRLVPLFPLESFYGCTNNKIFNRWKKKTPMALKA